MGQEGGCESAHLLQLLDKLFPVSLAVRVPGLFPARSPEYKANSARPAELLGLTDPNGLSPAARPALSSSLWPALPLSVLTKLSLDCQEKNFERKGGNSPSKAPA